MTIGYIALILQGINARLWLNEHEENEISECQLIIKKMHILYAQLYILNNLQQL